MGFKFSSRKWNLYQPLPENTKIEILPTAFGAKIQVLTGTFRAGSILQTITLYDDIPRIDIDNKRIVRKGKWKTVEDFGLLLEKINSVMCSLVSCIGISSGGFWDENGKSIGYETVNSTSENRLTKVLSEQYGCPVFIENDARCALLAEKEYGVLKDRRNAVLFVLGSSLGCAVLINGKLFSGSTKQAGALFMMPAYYDGDDYRFDEQANSIKITKEYDASLAYGNMLLIEKAAALKCWYAYLAYDPELIAFGGGISNSEYILGRIKYYPDGFFEHDKSIRKPLITKTQFGEDSNLPGAPLLSTVKDE